jgi:secreted trypsin-like serine protease
MYLLIVCIVIMIQPSPALYNESQTDSMLTTNKRIIGGGIAQPHSYPFIVGLEENKYHFCGGTILTDSWILTAAHCVFARLHSIKTISVVVGDHSKSTLHTNELTIHPDKVVVHPKFNGLSPDSDLALLHLSSKLIFNEHVRPIKLARTDPQINRRCMLAGWGDADVINRKTSPFLKVVTVTVLDNKKCKSLRKGYKHLNDNMFCAGNVDGGHDTCSGDSGGPLICQDKLDKTLVYQQYGVVSMGAKKCAMKDSAAVYVRLSKFNAWINIVIRSKIQL